MIFLLLMLFSYKLTPHQQSSPGLFCVFNSVLGALDAYDKKEISGLTVDFGTEGLYYDPKVGPNWWTYYFEPIAIGEQTDFKLFPQYKKTIFSLTGSFEMSLERSHELIEKYVKVKPEILSKVEKIYQEQFAGSYVLGIHYRGTDKKTDSPEVSYGEVASKAEEILKDRSGAKIFVATDDARFLNVMKKRFSYLTVFGLDAIRSDNGKPVHMGNSDENYRKGEEAVVDALLLARCNFLLKNSSNLSQWSRKYNPAIPTLQLNSSYYEGNDDAPDYFSNFNTMLTKLDRNDPMPLEEMPNYRKRIYSLLAQYEMTPERAHELYTQHMQVKMEPKTGPALGVYYHQSKEERLQPKVPYETVWSAIKQQLQGMPSDTRLVLVTKDKSFKKFLEAKHPLIADEGAEMRSALLLSQCDALIRTCNTFSKAVTQLNPKLFCVDLDKNWQEKE